MSYVLLEPVVIKTNTVHDTLQLRQDAPIVIRLLTSPAAHLQLLRREHCQIVRKDHG